MWCELTGDAGGASGRHADACQGPWSGLARNMASDVKSRSEDLQQMNEAVVKAEAELAAAKKGEDSAAEAEARGREEAS